MYGMVHSLPLPGPYVMNIVCAHTVYAAWHAVHPWSRGLSGRGERPRLLASCLARVRQQVV